MNFYYDNGTGFSEKNLMARNDLNLEMMVIRFIDSKWKNSDMNNLKILIVEDEAIAALCLSQQLKNLDLNVLPPVGRGEKAVDVSIRERPDVIFMDIVLASNMNGIEAAKEILQIYTPVIIFTTGYQDKKYAEQINSLRAFVFYKPYDINDLLSVMEQKFAIVSEV